MWREGGRKEGTCITALPLGSHYVSYPTHAFSEASAQPDSFVRCLGVAEPILYRNYTPIKQKQEKQDMKTHGPAPQSTNTTFYTTKRY